MVVSSPVHSPVLLVPPVAPVFLQEKEFLAGPHPLILILARPHPHFYNLILSSFLLLLVVDIFFRQGYQFLLTRGLSHNKQTQLGTLYVLVEKIVGM